MSIIARQSRQQVIRSVNSAHVCANWLIGKQIVEAEQGGEQRASYGKALLSQLQDFLLELSSGFAFVGRQVRLTLDGDHFYPDMVFYHDIANADDNPTIGLILCSEKNDAVVRYVLGDHNQQIFASRYQLHLPTEEQLQQELQRELDKLTLPKPNA